MTGGTRARRTLRAAPPAVAIVIVLAGYAWVASGGTFRFPSITWYESMYAGLSEGFLAGHLYMANEPTDELMALPNPYDYAARQATTDYLWDASYFNRHYYLYFSPVPALLFYVPYRFLSRAYPSDALAATVFASWAFLAAVGFARRARALTAGTHIPLTLWILLIGFGNVVAFLLVEVHIYQVTILAGAALTATWAVALLRYFEQPAPGRAVWVGIWLALAIATRPNLIPLALVTAFAILRTTKSRTRMLAAAAIPAVVTLVALLAYNGARFGKPLEFGQSYQLTFVPMQGRAVCSLCTFPELLRFGNNVMHYVFWAPAIRTRFPFIDMRFAEPDPAVSFPMRTAEEVIGVAPLVPLAILATLIAILLVLRKGATDSGTRVAIYVMAGAWLVLFALSTCWWIVSRYSMDFLFLMTAAAVPFVETALTLLDRSGLSLGPLKAAVAAVALYSIVAGILLGFDGQNDAFQRLHPKMLQSIRRALR